MLMTSAAILALFGFGFSLISTSEDNEDSLPDGDSSADFELDDEAETVSLDSILEFGQAAAELQNEYYLPSSGSSQAAESESESVEKIPFSEQTDQPYQNNNGALSFSIEDATHHSKISSGGPGDTIVGDSGVDQFVVTVGRAGDPETVIENLFEVDPGNEGFETDDRERMESIWLKDPNGSLYSKEDLLASDMKVAYDYDRGGVSISLNGHATLFLKDTYLDDFTENSLVIGNFGLA